jgi:predicted O-methyltransferase YrrM
MKKLIKPLLKPLVHSRAAQAVARQLGYAPFKFAPPGHFYSPVPDVQEVLAEQGRIFDLNRRTLPGIDLREKEQSALLQSLSGYYAEQPFAKEKQKDVRYYFDNEYYSYSDAIFLYAMIRHFRPLRIIEVGSGFSSCVMLDTNERFFGGKIQIDLIEPRPERLYSLLFPRDRETVRCRRENLQDVPLDFFRELGENDILFIDSSHVCRIDSDVNYYMFEILPVLKPGVLIHIHDVFNGFEYTKAWIEEGKFWSEAYLLRAFLEYNQNFEILLFQSFLAQVQPEFIAQHMPLCRNDAGSAIWLRKKA